MKEQKIQMLQYLLSQSKYDEIVKIMVNEHASIQVLKQYKGSTLNLKHSHQFQQNKIMKKLANFTIQELILMKGSTKQKPKFYQNTILIKMIKNKLREEIPEEKTRLKLWIQFTDIFTHQQLYDGLQLLNTPTDFSNIIAKDIHRTQTSQIIKNQATEVLSQFSKYNPFIGYCQGMNYIVAFILQNGFSREQAFFILKKITECIIPTDYYTTMGSPVNDIRILYHLIYNFYPKLFKKIKQIMKDIDGSYMVVLSFAFQWFLCLFTNNTFNIKIRNTIWDRLLVEGDIVLFKASLVIIDIISQSILSTQTFEEYLFTIESAIPKIHSVEQFIEKYNKLYINIEIINLIRFKLASAYNQQKPNTFIIKSFHKKCRKSWTACMQEIQQKNQSSKRDQIFVFRKKNNVQLIPNYLQTFSVKYFQPNKKYAKESDKLIIGRMDHICNFQQDTQDQIQKQTNKPIQKKMIRTDGRNKNNDGNMEKYRNKILTFIQNNCQEDDNDQKQEKKPFQRSQSILFIKDMVKNVSFRNLLDFYEDVDLSSKLT